MLLRTDSYSISIRFRPLYFIALLLLLLLLLVYERFETSEPRCYNTSVLLPYTYMVGCGIFSTCVKNDLSIRFIGEGEKKKDKNAFTEKLKIGEGGGNLYENDFSFADNFAF